MVKLEYAHHTGEGEVLEVETVQREGFIQADAGTSIRRTSGPSLRPTDADLIAAWASSLRAASWATSSIKTAQKSLRAFARGLSRGFLHATRADVADFFQDRQLALNRRDAR